MVAGGGSKGEGTALRARDGDARGEGAPGAMVRRLLSGLMRALAVGWTECRTVLLRRS